MLSEIQAKIMAVIARSDGLRYSEAYPGEEIDDDLYNYHLQELVKKGLLSKIDKKYQLTNTGKREISHFNRYGDDPGRFQVNTILVVMRNKRSEILIHKRRVHPHRGEISTVSGKVKIGELIVEAAKRRLKEETGLETSFKQWGVFRAIRKTAEGELFEDMVFCICVAQDPSGELNTISDFGENWWENFNKIYEYLDEDPAIAEIEKRMLKQIQAGHKVNNPIPEEVVVLKSY